MAQQIQSTQRHTKIGWFVTGCLVIGFGGWASLTHLSSAIVAQGVLVVDGKIKNVQHLEGGLVRQIRVKDGDLVVAGQLLMRLDDTAAKAGYAIISGQIDELIAQKARLEAELAGYAAISIPRSLAKRRRNPAIKRIIEGQQALFSARLASLKSQTAQLRLRIVQMKDVIVGEEVQKVAKETQHRILSVELRSLKKLHRQRHVAKRRLVKLETEIAQLSGERGAHVASIARSKNTIGETKLKIEQLKIDRREKANKDLRATVIRLMELQERLTAIKATLKRTDIRASKDGYIHNMSIHTVGGVVAPAATVMQIVPNTNKLLVEVKVEPRQIDKVKVGQSSTVRFTAFDAKDTPSVDGRVTYVSADLREDQRSGQSSYVAKIAIDATAMKALGKRLLRPGMPTEVYINTGSKTPLAYLVEPITDQIRRAMRED